MEQGIQLSGSTLVLTKQTLKLSQICRRHLWLARLTLKWNLMNSTVLHLVKADEF
jgi:hypothetical protein